MVSSRVYPGLERKPGGPDNWVERAGSLPDYIERIAKHLHYEKGMTISQAIATAVNTVKRWTTGTNHDGSRLKPETVAKAAAAVAQWEALKAKARVSSFTASVTVELPDLPPLSAFADPQFTTAMPMTLTADGRVSGHAALWDSCHRGFAEGCKTPPRSPNGYKEFHTGVTAAVDETDGEVYYVPTGVLTYGTDHPSEGIRGAIARSQYYSNTGTSGADVVVGEDDIGLWVAGIVRPGMAENITAAFRNPLSGDWVDVLKYDEGVTYGNLVALLAVNAPGFNIHASLDVDEDDILMAACSPCEAIGIVNAIEAYLLVASIEKELV